MCVQVWEFISRSVYCAVLCCAVQVVMSLENQAAVKAVVQERYALRTHVAIGGKPGGPTGTNSRCVCVRVFVCLCVSVYASILCVNDCVTGNFSPCGRRTYKSNFGLARRARPKLKRLTPGVPEKSQWPDNC